MKINPVIKKILFFLIIQFSVATVHAQEDRIELTEIEFSGNDFFSDSELEELIISKESSTWLSQFFYSFSSFGSPASYFDSLNIQDDLNILRNTYKAFGFFDADIKAESEIFSNDEKPITLNVDGTWVTDIMKNIIR